MPLLAARQEVAKKRAKAFPLGFPLALPLYKAHQEIDIKIFYAVLQVLSPRAAGVESKNSCHKLSPSFFNSGSQNLKVYAFAPQSEKL
ncbi:MAG: hypothetical protein IJW09_07505 [Clostridia bacterium]|nr:hypothetical protein [Clostridia bacterium]